MLRLYQAYRQVWENTNQLRCRWTLARSRSGRFPDAVRDMQQREANHFPELEKEPSCSGFGLERNDLFRGLIDYLSTKKGLVVKVMPVHVMTDTLRRYDHMAAVFCRKPCSPPGAFFQPLSTITS